MINENWKKNISPESWALIHQMHKELEAKDILDHAYGQKMKRLAWDVWFQASYNMVCVECGKTAAEQRLSRPQRLSTHHLDRNTKDFQIGTYIIAHKCSPEHRAIVAAEMAKCDVVCNRCHGRIHAREVAIA